MEEFLYLPTESSDESSDSADCTLVKLKLEELYQNLPNSPNLSDVGEVEAKRKRKRNGDRLPTRKPDPTIINRNALLARENRKKKKAHLENLETALQESKRINTSLLRALKRQQKVSRRLEREKLYYKNILTNRTDISSLVSLLNGQLRDTRARKTSPPQDSLYSCSGSSNYEPDYPPLAFDFSDNGSVTGEKDNFNGDLNFLDNFLTELEQPCRLDDAWNELLSDENFGLSGCKAQQTPDAGSDPDIVLNINKEHSYVSAKDDGQHALKNVTGVCLHIAEGKMFEFCPSCHWSANQTPPQQLLQEEAHS